MKLGPKEIKVVNEYFVRPVKNRLKEIFLKKGLPQLKTPDEVQRLQRALDKEAIDAFMKRNPKGDGGRMEYKKGTNLTNLEKKQNLYNKALRELPEGYLEDYKNIFLKDRGDGTFSRKSGEEGGFDFMRKKYENKLKQIKTRQGLTKNINEKIKVFNNAILQNLKKENKIVSGLKDKDAKRTKSVRQAQGRDIKYKAPKGYQAHHMLPLGSRIGMTNRDIAIISKEMNAALSEYDKPMNKLVEESMKLDFSKEGSLKKLDEINKKLASYVEKAEKELPKKYKGLIGFNKLTPVLDTFDEKGEQVFSVEKIGTDYKKSIGAKKIEKPLKDISTKELQKLAADAPRFSANPMFSPGILKEAFKQLPTPAGAVGLNLLFGVDPRSSIDRASIAAEAAFAPALVKQAAKLGSVGQKIANLGLTPAMAARVARIASPLGIASLGAEGLYQAGKFTKKRMEELRSMTPEQRTELRRQGEAQAFDPFQAAGGGLAKLAGDRSGAMLTSMNPDKDGLQGSLNRGKKQ